MVAQWDAIKARHEQLQQLLSDHSMDRQKRAVYQKELNHLGQVVDKLNLLQALEKNLAETQKQAADVNDAEMAALYQQEIQELKTTLEQEKITFDYLLAPPSPHDDRSVFLEIRAGTGGQEAALFASDLLKMYTQYALDKGWKVSVQDMSETDLGGFKEAVAFIKGDNVYAHLKRESGVHRVQRVPATETQGRVHTSTATVAVLPEAEDVEITIEPKDLRIDVYRAGGAGGQHVNTTDSAVRITHIPTNVVVTCQDERSQHKNKAKAMKMLQSRLLAAQEEKHMIEMSKQRKEQIGAGMRSEKVRTYNYPQNRVTDHQVELTLNKLDRIMLGDLDEIVEALRKDEHNVRKQMFLEKYV
jgi:peptide chain release factor 1